MTEYTPTTEQVRTEWVESNTNASKAVKMHAGDAFDRWLAEHERQVAEKAWDLCLDTIEAFELNTAQSRSGNPYRAEVEGAQK